MSKWKESFTAGRKYRPEWEKLYTWIEHCKLNNNKAFSKICEKKLQPRKAPTEKHNTIVRTIYTNQNFSDQTTKLMLFQKPLNCQIKLNRQSCSWLVINCDAQFVPKGKMKPPKNLVSNLSIWHSTH